MLSPLAWGRNCSTRAQTLPTRMLRAPKPSGSPCQSSLFVGGFGERPKRLLYFWRHRSAMKNRKGREDLARQKHTLCEIAEFPRPGIVICERIVETHALRAKQVVKRGCLLN